MSKPKKPIVRKHSWRDYPDANHRVFITNPSPESLRPAASTVESAVSGNPNARAIIDSYAFRFPVTVVQVLP